MGETTDLVKRYNLELLWIVDDNFLIDLDRAVGIAEGLVRRGVKFDWSIQASTNLVSRLSVDDLKLLKRLAQNPDFFLGEAVAIEISKRPSAELREVAELCAGHAHFQAAQAGRRAAQRAGKSYEPGIKAGQTRGRAAPRPRLPRSP